MDILQFAYSLFGLYTILAITNKTVLNINIQVFILTYACDLDYCLGVMSFNFLKCVKIICLFKFS